ncbi:MAG: FAD-dependent oxidoreductase, partial [Parvibaculaceae bacterium]
MTGKPYRLPKGGRLIDRSKKASFTFDGVSMTGFAGDTVASAVLAHGQRVLGRSFKYHRPRGVVGLGAEEMNGLIGVGEGAHHEPNQRATQVELHDGLVAVSQNRWPSLSFDIGAVNSKVSRFIPGGFYYKTFMWPQAFWKNVYEPLIRRAAGLGKAPQGRDPDTYEHMHAHCDVLVIGAGIAGLAAAEAAQASGKRVIICDEGPRFGGVVDLSAGAIDGSSPTDWAKSRAQLLAEADNVHVMTRTTAVGHWHHNYVMLFERVADHDPTLLAKGAPRHRLWKVRARQIVLASGAIERPIAFANNDRPGIMLATAARALVERYGVAPGMRGVVFTNNDDAYLTALTLKRAGIGVAAVVDVRPGGGGALAEETRAQGIDILAGHAIAGVEASFGGLSLTGVKVASWRQGQGRVVSERRLPCDFVAMSGGFNPAVNLWCHNGGKLTFDSALQSYKPGKHHDAIRAAGAANGTMDIAGCLTEGYAAGEAAVKAAAPGISRPKAEAPAQA